MLDKKNNGNCLYCGLWKMCEARKAVATVCHHLSLDSHGEPKVCHRKTIEGNLFKETAQNCDHYKEAEHDHSRIMTVIGRQDVKDGHPNE